MRLRIHLRSGSLMAAAAALLLTGCSGTGRKPGSTSARGPAPRPIPPIPGSLAARDSARTGPWFADVTEHAGINFHYQSSKTPRKYLVETFGSGCAFFDYDGDGWLDILLLNGAPLPGGSVTGRPTPALYRNNRDGTFTDVTHEAGLDTAPMYAMGVAVGDYDNDGREDLYISCVLGPSHLFHNDGGHFRDVAADAGVANPGMWGTSCAWVDYDRDGKLDLFVCNYVRYRSLADDIPCTVGGKHDLVYCLPQIYDPSRCSLFHNEGGGRFKDVSQSSGIAASRGKSLGVAIWDYDHDGWPDIFVANDTVAGFLFHNERNGTFKEVGVESGIAFDDTGQPHSGMGIDTADEDGSGRTALVITNYYGVQTSFYRQAGAAQFSDDRARVGIGSATARVLGFGVGFADFDNDGWLDVLQVNGHIEDNIEIREPQTAYAEPPLLFHGGPEGAYREVGLANGAPFDRPIVGRGLAWGDYDNDGRLDALITSNNGPAYLWHNVKRAGNHWLTVKLIGTKSNRDGIGAEVRATAGGRIHHTMVRSGSSYLSQSDLRAHVGLGSATHADIEIRWPSGIVDSIRDVAADHIMTVREGAAARK